MKFAVNLKLTREKNKISIKELAEAIGVKPYTISDYESSRSEPSIANLIKIANYFNVSIDFLVGNTLPSLDGYDNIINIINDYQANDRSDEVKKLLNDLDSKSQEKIINILKSIKKEMFNK